MARKSIALHVSSTVPVPPKLLQTIRIAEAFQAGEDKHLAPGEACLYPSPPAAFLADNRPLVAYPSLLGVHRSQQGAFLYHQEAFVRGGHEASVVHLPAHIAELVQMPPLQNSEKKTEN